MGIKDKLRQFFKMLHEFFAYLWFLVPSFVAISVGFRFLNETCIKPEIISPESRAILISGIGLTATLSGLAFRASSSCVDTEKKNKYFKSGESFLYAVVMFIYAFVIKYAAITLLAAENLSKIKRFALGSLSVFQVLLFFFALRSAVLGLMDLQDILTGFTRQRLKSKAK